jgi:hypothetical protein
VLEIIAVVLAMLWGVAYLGPYQHSLGHFVHLLLLAAAVAGLIRLIQVRRAT